MIRSNYTRKVSNEVMENTVPFWGGVLSMLKKLTQV
jgi:hypothetical protein